MDTMTEQQAKDIAKMLEQIPLLERMSEDVISEETWEAIERARAILREMISRVGG